MSAENQEANDVIPASEAAAMLGLTLPTFHRRVKEHGIAPTNPNTNPLVKRPKRLLFNRADIEALKQRPSPAPPAPGSGVKREE